VVARAVGVEPPQVRAIELASTLHDVGKIGTPPAILFKPGKLTDDEFRITKEHCALGHQLLATVPTSPILQLGAEIAVAHHERWDGAGYPHGISGANIPLPARIVAIADVFDALTTRRIYKPAINVEQSLQILGKESGKHFDPELVDAFQRVFSEILDVKRRFTPED
jgi:putative two-component system response regulator